MSRKPYSQSVPKPRKPNRRTFTDAEKSAMIHECEMEGVTFESVARKYKIKTSQLYVWRKQIQKGKLSSAEDESSLDVVKELNAMFRELKRLERELAAPVGVRLKAELQSGQLKAYSAATSLSSLTNALCRLQDQQLEILDRLSEFGFPEDKEPEPFDLETDRAAEQLCLDLIEFKIEMDKKIREAERLQAPGA